MALVLINVDLAGHRSLDVLSTTNSVAAKWSVSQMGRRGRRALIKDLKRKANSLSRGARQRRAKEEADLLLRSPAKVKLIRH